MTRNEMLSFNPQELVAPQKNKNKSLKFNFHLLF
jgi:hypothetical protein